MKSKLFIILAAVMGMLLLIACSTALNPVSVKVSCPQFINNRHLTKEIEVHTGDSFMVSLCSNATTGFAWSEAAEVNQALVKQVDHEFIPPDSTTVGAAGREVWTFKSLKTGKATLFLEYSQAWEGGMKGEWTFTLNVIIK